MGERERKEGGVRAGGRVGEWLGGTVHVRLGALLL